MWENNFSYTSDWHQGLFIPSYNRSWTSDSPCPDYRYVLPCPAWGKLMWLWWFFVFFFFFFISFHSFPVIRSNFRFFYLLQGTPYGTFFLYMISISILFLVTQYCTFVKLCLSFYKKTVVLKIQITLCFKRIIRGIKISPYGGLMCTKWPHPPVI